MKVDMAQVAGAGDLKVKTGTGSFASSLKEGDIINAEVLSGDRGIVVMKTDGGQTFKARPDVDVTLSPGDKVLLEMVGKEAGIVSLSIREEYPTVGETPGQAAPEHAFADKTLLPYASRLTELNMPVTEENARLMRELLAQNPGMNQDEAAFIASNKLAGDERLIMAAIALLTDGEKMDAMLERLETMLQGSAQAPERGESPAGREAQIAPHLSDVGQFGIDSENTEAEQITPDASYPSAPAALHPVGREAQIEPLLREAGQFGTVSENTEAKQITPGASHPSAPAVPHPSSSVGRDVQIAPLLRDAGQFGTDNENTEARQITPGVSQPSDLAAPNPAGRETQIEPLLRDAGQFGTDNENTEAKQIAPGVPNPVGNVYQNAPDSTFPVDRADQFPSAEGWRTAPGWSASNSIPLASLLDEIFTRIEKNDKDTGIRLKNAKEELFARLLLVEETIARAETPAKTLILEQTRRLIDHIRLQDAINQFAYMQLPVQIGDEKKTAELYLFKKKAGKRLDPENVNILLALELENMGHWEGLINVRNKDVSIRMEVQDQKQKEYFSENTVLLHELLAEAGFRLVGTDITYSENETTPLTALLVVAKQTVTRVGIDYMV